MNTQEILGIAIAIAVAIASLVFSILKVYNKNKSSLDSGDPVITTLPCKEHEEKIKILFDYNDKSLEKFNELYLKFESRMSKVETEVSAMITENRSAHDKIFERLLYNSKMREK